MVIEEQAVQITNGIELTPTGLRIPGATGPEECIDAGQRLGRLGHAVQWALGDLINFVWVKHGEKYHDVATVTGYDEGTLANMVYVANHYEPARRRDGLSWTHHKQIASLEPDDQDELLARAEEEAWSTRDLAKAANGNGGKSHRAVKSSFAATVTFTQEFDNEQLQRATVASLRAEAERLGFAEK